MAQPETVTRDDVRSRRLSTEEVIRQQWDRINEIRTDVARKDRTLAWSEANETLFDALMPWWRQEKNKKWLKEKWERRELRVLVLPDERRMASPTATQCRSHQQLLLELMDDNDLLVRRRNTSGPAERKFDADPTAPAGTDLAGIEVPA